jgi:hypothetical protein
MIWKDDGDRSLNSLRTGAESAVAYFKVLSGVLLAVDVVRIGEKTHLTITVTTSHKIMSSISACLVADW